MFNPHAVACTLLLTLISYYLYTLYRFYFRFNAIQSCYPADSCAFNWIHRLSKNCTAAKWLYAPSYVPPPWCLLWLEPKEERRRTREGGQRWVTAAVTSAHININSSSSVAKRGRLKQNQGSLWITLLTPPPSVSTVRPAKTAWEDLLIVSVWPSTRVEHSLRCYTLNTNNSVHVLIYSSLRQASLHMFVNLSQ